MDLKDPVLVEITDPKSIEQKKNFLEQEEHKFDLSDDDEGIVIEEQINLSDYFEQSKKTQSCHQIFESKDPLFVELTNSESIKQKKNFLEHYEHKFDLDDDDEGIIVN